MDSRGVMPPESSCSGSRISTISRPNCGMERAMVARKMPMAVVANRHSAAPAMNRGMLPSTGTCSSPRTTRCREMPAASSTTAPIDQTLASMICVGVTGMTSRCSMVPCSRSRISAAPVRMMESMVTLLMICISAPNQILFSPGLKRARSSSATGRAVAAR